jgi:hypothetical protein
MIVVCHFDQLGQGSQCAVCHLMQGLPRFLRAVDCVNVWMQASREKSLCPHVAEGTRFSLADRVEVAFCLW